MTLQLWETLKEAIVVYTLATFFAVLALLVATYHVLSGRFVPSDTHHRPRSLEEMQPQPPPVQVGEITEEEQKHGDGSDPMTTLVVNNRDSSTPSSSSLTRSCPYDVFLSFRGVDTRNNFTGHLYTYLAQKGISTFIDDEELRKGDEISSSLHKAIQGSKISILIFSENYASSRWCLDELVEILQCMKLKQQLVWPVFYKVDPTDVRKQTGKYGEELAKHECTFKDNMDKVKRWRTALTDAANLSGWTFFDGHEANFISKIAEEISVQVSKRSYLNVARYPVGIETRVEEMLALLDVGESDVRMVGIWGIGGLGKTTIAKAVYNSIRHKFEGCCFLANVRAASVPHQGLVGLQNDLLYEILGSWEMKMTDADRGIQVIKERLGNKRVLLVLDDVNEMNQLEKLAGGLDWFGCGSRVIITTRDKRLLISHHAYPIYMAKALDNDEARDLLIWNALKENTNPDESDKFPIDTAVQYAYGLPLAINILGSLLCNKSINQWHAALDSYRRFPNNDIHEVLKTSYIALEYPLREAFLDIACFLKGKYKDYVMQALHGSYLNPANAIEVLKEKALISTDEAGRICMHDLLEEMGKEIVRNESPEDAGRRSRLWFHEDVCRVLTENTGSNKVRGIRVELPREDEICLSAKCFKKMKNLQLFININACFSGEVNHLPNQLRFLDWPGFPAQSLPSDFNPQNLVKLSMPKSRISLLGQGLKNMQNLKSLSFESCKFLTKVPDLSGMFPNLENLNFSGCTNLAELHSSVGLFNTLVYLALNDCYNLKTFPRMVNMKSLQGIDFRGCKRLENFPEIVGRMESLRVMDVSGTAITEVSSSIGYDLFNLQDFRLDKCKNLTNLPLSIYELKELRRLELTFCPELVLTPFPKKVKYCEVLTPSSNSKGKAISSESENEGHGIVDGHDHHQINLGFPSLQNFFAGGSYDTADSHFLETLGCASTLKRLDLSRSNFVSIPAGLFKFISLQNLYLRGCKRLQEVPELPPNLKRLDVSGCVSLQRIYKLSKILKHQESQMFEWLNLRNCWRLCGNLVREAENKGLFLNEAYHFSLFLSSQESAFRVVFPSTLEIPKWFSCQMDFKENGLFEFEIEILPNFKWENTGVALCVAGEQKLDWEFEICIDELPLKVGSFKDIIGYDGFDYEAYSARVWLLYIPFDRLIIPFGYERGEDYEPITIQVRIYQTLSCNVVPLKRCGVHLVMPPNEECMKLSRAQNVRSRTQNRAEDFC